MRCTCVGCGLRSGQNKGFYSMNQWLTTGGRWMSPNPWAKVSCMGKGRELLCWLHQGKTKGKGSPPSIYSCTCIYMCAGTHIYVYQPEKPQKGRLQMQPPSPSLHLLLRYLWKCHFQRCHRGPAWQQLLPPSGSGRGRDLSSTRCSLETRRDSTYFFTSKEGRCAWTYPLRYVWMCQR